MYDTFNHCIYHILTLNIKSENIHKANTSNFVLIHPMNYKIDPFLVTI